MSEVSAILALPYLMPAQAQKHVTHNEALKALDVLVQLAVASRAVGTPPVSPAEGDRAIVGSPATGAWAGCEDRIAAWLDGAWAFFAPRPGWRAQVLDEGRTVTWDGSAWQDDATQVVDEIGVNATPDATNRLAVSAPAVLLTHEGAGHQLKVNKAAAGDTASLLFQTGFSGRAEMGLAGSDDFAVKVSADGSAWATGLSLDAATGRLDAPSGLTVAGSAAYHRGNILGTVAQAAGLPTGAVLEQGQNANGDYVKLADGTLICTSPALSSGAVTAAAGALFQSADLAWTFPESFATAPAVSGSAGAVDRWCCLADPSASAVTFRVTACSSGAGATDARLVAVGRWI